MLLILRVRNIEKSYLSWLIFISCLYLTNILTYEHSLHIDKKKKPLPFSQNLLPLNLPKSSCTFIMFKKKRKYVDKLKNVYNELWKWMLNGNTNYNVVFIILFTIFPFVSLQTKPTFLFFSIKNPNRSQWRRRRRLFSGDTFYTPVPCEINHKHFKSICQTLR